MCWEMINPPQRPLLRSGGTSSVIFGSRELLLLCWQLSSCSQMCLSMAPSHCCPRHRVPASVRTPFLAALRQAAPAAVCVLWLSPVPPLTGVSVSQVNGSTQSRPGDMGPESSLGTAVLYPVVFLPGLFQFPALSYLELKSQTSSVYLLCACLGVLICELDVVRCCKT